MIIFFPQFFLFNSIFNLIFFFLTSNIVTEMLNFIEHTLLYLVGARKLINGVHWVIKVPQNRNDLLTNQLSYNRGVSSLLLPLGICIQRKHIYWIYIFRGSSFQIIISIN